MGELKDINDKYNDISCSGNDKEFCGNCYYFNGGPEDVNEQFCDKTEGYTLNNLWCFEYIKRKEERGEKNL